MPVDPAIAYRKDSASVVFPLPLGPIIHVRPFGNAMVKPARNPPEISIELIYQLGMFETVSDRWTVFDFSLSNDTLSVMLLRWRGYRFSSAYPIVGVAGLLHECSVDDLESLALG